MAAQVAYTMSQQANAERLLSMPEKWARGRSKVDGREFWVIQGSTGHAHWTALDGSGCTCRGFYYRGACSHSLAARRRMEDGQAPAPTPRETFDRLVATLTDEQIAASATAAARVPWRPCRMRGCTEPTTGRLCLAHEEQKARLSRELGA